MTEISKRLKNTPLCALSGFSFIPERRDPHELTYFGNQKKEVSVLLYDQVFKVQQGYNNKIHRDDREHSHSQGLNVNAEQLKWREWALSKIYKRFFPSTFGIETIKAEMSHEQTGFPCDLSWWDSALLIENARIVPVLSSSHYGKRPPLEPTNRSFVRISRVKKEFYRRNGIANYLEEDQQ